ncbi:MAG: 50S ribosomal protein L23 [Patescibacteria group bacterium]
MALFSSDTKKKTAKVPAVRRGMLHPEDGRIANVLKNPWFSEKALIGTENGVYVFEVPPAVTKHDVMNAIEKTYKVNPVKVNIVNLPAKKKSLRTKRGVGTRARRHKAYVYLKKGDTIAFT